MIVGIDPSLSRTGVAVIDRDARLIETWTVTSNPKHPTGARLVTLVDGILNRRRHHEPEPLVDRAHAVWIEDVFVGKYGKATLGLARLHGAILHELAQRGITPGVVENGQWKKHATGSYRPSKPQYTLAAANRFHWPFATDDEAAAALIALYGLTHGETK